jgi:Flp pilus assembly protein TadG
MNDYTADKPGGITHFLRSSLSSKGQALVEFTLVFIILVIVAWIPADFGLAFYTAQLASNAARDGARIAAADRTLTAGNPSCTLGTTCNSATGALKKAADRLSPALLPGATVQLNFPFTGSAANCDQTVRVSIAGTYNFFFYQLLRLFGISSAGSPTSIQRQNIMRWEHQC